MKKYDHGIMKLVFSIEVILAIFIIATVLISGGHLVRRIYQIFYMDVAGSSYDLFEKFLAHALLLVIGLELAMMLVNHTPAGVIEVMLYAVARKMLIYTHSTYEMLIGVVALAGIFFIRKYLYCAEVGNKESKVLSGLTPVKSINNIKGITIPEELGMTVGEVIKKLACGEEVSQGDIFEVADVQLEVVKAKEGTVDKVKVSSLGHN